MIKTEFTNDQLAEIYFALGNRVNLLIDFKKNHEKAAQFEELINRQLQRTNEVLAIVEKIVSI